MPDKALEEKIANWLKKHEQWQEFLQPIRDILLASKLEETLKWGTPTYTIEGKNVLGLAGFKNHCALWFHQGVFLKDEKGVLINAQEGTTKGLRQWRFEKGDQLPKTLLKSYVKEAIANQKAGKTIKPQIQTQKPSIPVELQQALTGSKKVKSAFEKLTPGKQREYAQHISDAKREATRQARVEKITPMILAGVGLNDKYRNC